MKDKIKISLHPDNTQKGKSNICEYKNETSVLYQWLVNAVPTNISYSLENNSILVIFLCFSLN